MYVTADEMRSEYGEDILVQLTDAQSWDAEAIARVNAKLVGASAIVDGFVAKYYAVQSGTPVPELLKLITRRIAFKDLARVPTDDAKADHKWAMEMLGKIAAGLVKLDQGDTAALATRDGAVLVEDPGRTFSRDSLGGF